MGGLAIITISLLLYTAHLINVEYKKFKNNYKQVFVSVPRDNIIHALLAIVVLSNVMTWILTSIN